MSAKIGSRAGRDVEHSAEAVAVFWRKAASHQVHSFEDLRAHAGTELRLRIVQKRDPVDELMQRKFGAANGQKIVVTVACARHQVVDQIIGGVDQRIGQLLQILLGKDVGAAGLFRIDGSVSSLYFHGLLHRFLTLQFDGERQRLTGAENKIVAGKIEACGIGLQSIRSGLDGGKMKFSRGVARDLLGDAAFRTLQNHIGACHGFPGGITK